MKILNYSELNVFKKIKSFGEISSKRFVREKCIQDSWMLLIIIVDNIIID